jgi:hypothetical protein
MTAAWKKKLFDLTRIRSHDLMRTSPVHYHRADAPWDASILIYIT